MDILNVVIYLLLILIPILYGLIQKRYAYWKDRGIPYVEPVFIYGSAPKLRSQKLLSDNLQSIYDKYKGKIPFVGLFLFFKPTITILNLDYVKNILIKDFHSFTDRGIYYNERDDPLSAHLFALDGHKWQSLRKKLSPTFTSGKMKFMFPTVVEVGERFADVFGTYVKNGQDIAIKELLARFTTDVIGTCAFGIDCNSLKDPNAEFRLMGRKIFNEARNGRLGRAFITNFPELSRKIGIKTTRDDVNEFFMKAVKDTVAYREQNNVSRNDFMDILIQLKNEKTLGTEDGAKGNLTIEQVAAQAFVFFIAGFETSSTTMGFCLYELAKNQEVQNKLRNEIQQVLKRHNGKLTYESMNEMHYLEQVLSETLRKYPVVPILFRKPVVDYKMPDSDFVIPKKTLVFIPVKSIHYDEEIYEEPEKFDPDRFTPQAIQTRHPQAWLPFGDGPRNCIGLRFGKMQAKIGLVFLLQKFKFNFCDKTMKNIVYNPKSFVLATKEDIVLRFIFLLYILLILIPILYVLMKKHYDYWKNRGIPFVEPKLIFGNAPKLGSQKHIFDNIQKIYDKFKGKIPFIGLFLFFKPTITILNLDYVKNILIKDFHVFADRGIYYNERDDPLSAHLFALDGHKWQPLRKKLSPTFTSGKMKFMFPTVVEVGERFADVFGTYVKNGQDIAIKELLARFTTDVIGTCAFGIDCNSLKDPNAEFRLMGRKIFNEGRFGRIFTANFPDFSRKLGIKGTSDDVSAFFMKAVKDTVEYREQNKISRNDFMDLLIQLKNEKTIGIEDDKNGNLTFQQVAAQAFVFFIAGFETSSTTMGFCLYELAKNQEVQNKLRNEIQEVLKRYNGKLTYESMNEMHYLEQVLSETLRKYPVVPILFRKPVIDYKMPDSDFVIPKKTLVFIPVRSIHYDEEIYEEPEKFDPDRFTPEAIETRHPQAWLPFGDGPRNCIGLRFGKMQAKIGLIFLLQNFKFSCCNKTMESIVYDPKSFILATKEEIVLRVEEV
ncbi:probable cytochrome P450 6a21 [Condylostylus longicornis]|uniref:probable cytochrome P450 6a21 n=1 Tax=Condylostylus longicornis TaxID=2530218 RepID=UPI00244E1BEF|nr:probable cytochrome P450 6a21 [Condylostylus longicornis]